MTTDGFETVQFGRFLPSLRVHPDIHIPIASIAPRLKKRQGRKTKREQVGLWLLTPKLPAKSKFERILNNPHAAGRHVFTRLALERDLFPGQPVARVEPPVLCEFFGCAGTRARVHSQASSIVERLNLEGYSHG
jgi:hypothetical protein